MTEPAEALEAARRISAHLEPGGVFIGSFSFEWRPGDPLDTGWELLLEKPRPGDGAIVRSWTRERRDPEEQLWHTEQRFEAELNGKVIETDHQRRSPEGRWYTQMQARELLEAAGFSDIQLLHDSTREPARPEDRLFCAMGTRGS